MAKKDPYLKQKVVEASARSLFGRKSEKDRMIEKWTDLGWELIKENKVRGKERYILTFEYRMSDEEIEIAKKRQRNTQLGCVGLIAVFVIYGLINSSQRSASIAATQTYAGTQVAYNSATAARQAVNDTATATLWTPTNTPTPSDTPTNTNTPTETDTPTNTPTNTNTPTPSDTPTNTNTPTVTNTPSSTFTPTITYTPSLTFTPSITPTVTPSATITDTPEPTPITPTNAPAVTYYIRATANARSCERTSCAIITKFSPGTSVSVVGTVEGESVSGNTTWERISHNGQIVYVHSSLVSENPPPTAAPVQVQQPGLISTVAPILPAQFVPNCSGEVYDCGDLTCSQMAIYWAACPGDPSGLDGNDNDGKYCESKCGG